MMKWDRYFTARMYAFMSSEKSATNLDEIHNITPVLDVLVDVNRERVTIQGIKEEMGLLDSHILRGTRQLSVTGVSTNCVIGFVVEVRWGRVSVTGLLQGIRTRKR